MGNLTPEQRRLIPKVSRADNRLIITFAKPLDEAAIQGMYLDLKDMFDVSQYENRKN